MSNTAERHITETDSGWTVEHSGWSPWKVDAEFELDGQRYVTLTRTRATTRTRTTTTVTEYFGDDEDWEDE